MTDRNELVILTPEQQVAAILARDARRMRRLTWVVAGLWVFTVLATGFMAAKVYGILAIPNPSMAEALKKRPDYRVDKLDLDTDVLRWAVASLAEKMVIAVGLVSTSALATLYLFHTGRRATSRQIQAGLTDISKQLAELRQKAGSPPVADTHQGS